MMLPFSKDSKSGGAEFNHNHIGFDEPHYFSHFFNGDLRNMSRSYVFLVVGFDV
jgi:hypothetical protein